MTQNQIIEDNEKYISIDKVAQLKGLKSNSSIRKAINNNKYIARKTTVKGGYTYEILVSSLEPELQAQLQDEEIKSTQLVPLNNKNNNNNNILVTETRKLEALAKIDLITNFKTFSTRYKKKKEAIKNFLELYNTGIYLKSIYKIIGNVSRSSLLSWMKTYDEFGTVECLVSRYKQSKKGEYNCCLTEDMQQIFLKFLLHPHQFNIGKSIHLTIQLLKTQGFENIPSDMTFRRFAQNYKHNNYDKWVLCREGEKAFNDKVEPYIERDISVLEVGDVIIADGHVLNFEVINPYTGRPSRATLVGFLDWKSTALVGYEIMVSENTQCIAAALRNSILNLGRIPKVVYQDNGRAFRAKYFQHCNHLFGDVKRARSSEAADFSPLSPSRFDEAGFNGVYANLGIQPVFAKVRNAKAKVIERFFREFQDEFEKMMPSLVQGKRYSFQKETC